MSASAAFVRDYLQTVALQRWSIDQELHPREAAVAWIAARSSGQPTLLRKANK